MKVEIEKLPQSKAKLKIEVPKEKVEEYLEKAYFEIAKNLKIPGFRPGHIPHLVIEEKVGLKAIHEEALRLLVPHAYVEAILDNKIVAIGRPEIKVTKFAPGNPLEFEAEVTVVPEVSLGDYKKIKIRGKEIEVEESEVDEVLKSLQKREAILEEKEGLSENGDWAEIDFDGFKNGIALEKLKSRNHPLIIGEGVLLPDFEKNLIGLKKGEEKETEVFFPKDYYDKDLAGEKINFKIKLLNIKKVRLPEINEGFVQKISGGTDKTLEGLKEDIKTALIKQKEHEERLRKESEVIEQILEKAHVEIPSLLVKEEIEQMKKDLEEKLATQGLKLSRYLEHIGKTEGGLEEDLKNEAERRIKVSLVLNSIADTEGIEVTDEETEAEMSKTKAENTTPQNENVDPAEAKKYIKVVLKNRKTLDKLLEYATK